MKFTFEPTSASERTNLVILISEFIGLLLPETLSISITTANEFLVLQRSSDFRNLRGKDPVTVHGRGPVSQTETWLCAVCTSGNPFCIERGAKEDSRRRCVRPPVPFLCRARQDRTSCFIPGSGGNPLQFLMKKSALLFPLGSS